MSDLAIVVLVFILAGLLKPFVWVAAVALMLKGMES